MTTQILAAEDRIASSEIQKIPFKGLTPFSEEDADFFFSREKETDIIIGNLMATRLLLFYGTSGVGKSSVLHAGVVHKLHQIARANLMETGAPELGVAVLDSWRDDPIAALKERICSAIPPLMGEQAVDPPSPELPLQEFLSAAAECVQGEFFIILDQFEEYFLYHAQEDGAENFGLEFPRAVNNPALSVSFLLSFREDALAKLDRFKHSIPFLFDNCLRLDYLNRAEARDAIQKPIKEYNKLHPDESVDIEPELMDRVLNDVAIGQIDFTDTGRAGNDVDATAGKIATPYLQLVMRRLWDEERRRGSRVLRLGTLVDPPPNGLGGAENIVRRHLDEMLSTLSKPEQCIAAEVFHYLVTRSGTKYAYSVDDLVDQTSLPEREISLVMGELSKGDKRILVNIGRPPNVRRAGSERYQIFHDVLAPAILDWRRRFVEQQEQEEIRRQHDRELAAEHERRERELAAERERRERELAEERLQRERERANAERKRQRMRVRGWIITSMVVIVGIVGVAWERGQRLRAEGQRQMAQAVATFVRAELDRETADRAYLLQGNVVANMLQQGGSAIYPLSLQQGEDYTIIAKCDENCALNLRLFRNGELIEADTLPGDRWVLSLTAPETGEYQLDIEMKECEGSCTYAYGLYHRPREHVVRSQLAIRSSEMKERGYEFLYDSVAIIDSAGTAFVAITLQQGADYAIFGRCDQRCHDLDLALYHGDQLIQEDIAPDDRPTLQITAPVDGEYRLAISMENCTNERCFYGYRLDERTQQTRARTAILRQLNLAEEELTTGRYRESYSDRVVNSLRAGADTTVIVEVQDPGEYVIVGVCDEGCAKLDLELHAGTRRVTAPAAPGDAHILNFTASEAQQYRLVVRMAQCATDVCHFGYQVFRQIK